MTACGAVAAVHTAFSRDVRCAASAARALV